MAKNKADQYYIPGLQRYPIIRDEKKFARLFKQWQKHKNQEAYNQLLFGNYRLVYYVANRYATCGVELSDLIQEGFMGMARALETFDPDRGNKISTYATPWIRHHILTALRKQSRTIRISSGAQENMTCVYRAIARFCNKNNRGPSDQEILDEIRTLDGTDKETGVSKNMTLKKVKFHRALLDLGTIALDARLPSGKGNNNGLVGDNLADTQINIAAEVELGQLQKNVLEAIGRIMKKDKTGRTLTFLRLRFELGQTLEEIGNYYELTRERARQIEKIIITKLSKDLKMPEDGLVEILRDLPLGAEKENPSPHTLPNIISVPDLFGIICEHVLLTPSGLRIVKEPLRTIQTRTNLSLEEAELALKGMKKQKLIEGNTPWPVIKIIPEVPIPEYSDYK